MDLRAHLLSDTSLVDGNRLSECASQEWSVGNNHSVAHLEACQARDKRGLSALSFFFAWSRVWQAVIEKGATFCSWPKTGTLKCYI